MDIVTKNLEYFHTIAPVGPFYAPVMSRSGRWMRPLTRSWRCTFFTCLVVEEIFTLFECWLLLNIALRLQGLTLRHPERSWSHLAGSFHDSDSTLCRIFYKCRFATNNHFQSQADHCQPQSWNSSRGTWQESQAEETADELILWSQNQSRLRSTMYRKPDSNKKL